MDEAAFHWWLAMALLLTGVGAFVRLSIGEQAPYGRYNNNIDGNAANNNKKGDNQKASSASASHGFYGPAAAKSKKASSTPAPHGFYGPNLPSRLAWFLMECPNLWVTAICLLVPGLADPACVHSPTNRVLLGLFVLHYAQRGLVYPLLMPSSCRPMPVGIMGLAWLFCVVNGYLQARYLTRLRAYPDTWLESNMFVVGTVLFFSGFGLNVHADSVLRGLARERQRHKAKKGQGYAIPRCGLFELVSSANYTAEMLEWSGFALASGLAYPAVIFSIFTVLNLAPRGVAHHRWYQAQFGDQYPEGRRALIPFVY